MQTSQVVGVLCEQPRELVVSLINELELTDDLSLSLLQFTSFKESAIKKLGAIFFVQESWRAKKHN